MIRRVPPKSGHPGGNLSGEPQKGPQGTGAYFGNAGECGECLRFLDIWSYLKSHPVTFSVNEIVAGQVTYKASTKTICGSVGLGASVPPTKALTVGILNDGSMPNWRDVFNGWSYSFGANLFVGYQGYFGSSGRVGGPTASAVGLSGSYTFGGCTTIP